MNHKLTGVDTFGTVINTFINMGKITIDLAQFTDLAISFDQYLVLHHLHNGKFEVSDDQWLVLDESQFEDQYMVLKKPSLQAVMVSLKHRRFIDLRAGMEFKIVNKGLFKAKNARKTKSAPIFSFRDNGSVFDYTKPSPILISCTKVKSWRSPEFVTAWNIFERDVRTDPTIKKPLTNGSAERLVNRLIRLSGNNEVKATAIINQSNENTWRGFWPLDDRTQKRAEPQDRKALIDSWYAKPETV